MNYLNISHADTVNGVGLRSVIWVSGCERKCPGCFSPYTHDFCAGIPFDNAAKEELFRDSKEDWCNGITVVGGEPLHPNNFQTVLEIVREHKMLYPNKTIWLYTGYCWNDIVQDSTMIEILKYLDVICDGPYVEALKDINIHWVGSSNQHVIDVKERIEKIKSL